MATAAVRSEVGPGVCGLQCLECWGQWHGTNIISNKEQSPRSSAQHSATSQTLIMIKTLMQWSLTSQSLVSSNLPGDEQRESVLTHGGGRRGSQVVQLAVEDVEAEVAHLWPADLVWSSPGGEVVLVHHHHSLCSCWWLNSCTNTTLTTLPPLHPALSSPHPGHSTVWLSVLSTLELTAAAAQRRY